MTAMHNLLKNLHLYDLDFEYYYNPFDDNLHN